jgi:hypothetical protein
LTRVCQEPIIFCNVNKHIDVCNSCENFYHSKLLILCEHLQKLYVEVLLLPSYLATFVFATNSIGLT